MAMIKSALEIALERSKDIKVDEAALEANALRIEGKKAAGRYLEDPETGNLAEKLGKYPKEKRPAVRSRSSSSCPRASLRSPRLRARGSSAS
jgi:hypothetical protein